MKLRIYRTNLGNTVNCAIPQKGGLLLWKKKKCYNIAF